VGDYKDQSWRESGLLYPSIVTGIVRTIKQDMIAGKLGELQPPSCIRSRTNFGDLGALTLLGSWAAEPWDDSWKRFKTIAGMPGSAVREIVGRPTR